jgi:hypothetical protein
MVARKKTEVEKVKMTPAALSEALRSFRPEEWEQIPDIDLYMDQVIMFMQRQHIGLDISDEETLTSAMINNYIKSGILPRANGKKYSREHIAYLTAICLLKQVLSVNDTGELLDEMMEHEDITVFYKEYGKVVDDEYTEVAERIKDSGKEELSKLALELAVSSYARKLACSKIVEMLGEDEEVSEDK